MPVCVFYSLAVTAISQYIFFQLNFLANAEPSHKGVSDSMSQHSGFPPHCAPCCATLWQELFS